VLVEGKKIVAVGRNLKAGGAAVIDARGRIVMPGFVDTHHHLFETALRSYLADGLLFDGLDARITQNYFQKILLTFAPVYPAGGCLHQHAVRVAQPARRRRDDGVRHLADPPLARAQRRDDQGAARLGAPRRVRLLRERRQRARNQYPTDAQRIKTQYFSSSDQLLSMFMGARSTCPATRPRGRSARTRIPVAAHIVGTFGMRDTFDALPARTPSPPTTCLST